MDISAPVPMNSTLRSFFRHILWSTTEHSDASLLSEMEHAGRQIEEESVREQMRDCALGTPATRAAIIERLIEVGYVRRSGKNLVATPKGVQLMEAAPGDRLAGDDGPLGARACPDCARRGRGNPLPRGDRAPCGVSGRAGGCRAGRAL